MVDQQGAKYSSSRENRQELEGQLSFEGPLGFKVGKS